MKALSSISRGVRSARSPLLRGLLLVCLAASTGCAARANEAAGAREVRTPPSPRELWVLAQAFGQMGDLTRAEQYASAALEAGAELRTTLPFLLDVCVRAGRYRVASEYVERYLRLDPENVDLHRLHGTLEAALGERDVALQEYRTVLRARPDDADAHYALALLLRDDLQDLRGADEHWRRYLEIAPHGPHAAEARASLLEEVQ